MTPEIAESAMAELVEAIIAELGATFACNPDRQQSARSQLKQAILTAFRYGAISWTEATDLIAQYSLRPDA